MSILYSILLTIHVLVCLLLVLLVMLQRPKQEGLGAAFASGMMNETLGANTTDVLQKGTRMMAITFFILATCLAVLKAHQHDANRVEAPAPETSEELTIPMNIDPNAPQGEPVPMPEIPVPAPEDQPATSSGTPAPETGAAKTPETPAEPSTPAPAESGEGKDASKKTEAPAAPENAGDAPAPSEPQEEAPKTPAQS